jgi:hypothetical protein
MADTAGLRYSERIDRHIKIGTCHIIDLTGV